MIKVFSFRQMIVNFSIVLMLASLGLVAFNNDLKSIFVSTTNTVYYKGDTSQKNVSFMVNVYWGNEFLPNMLDTFDKFNVKTTFFVGGMWVSKFPDELINLSKKGHEIANHGFFHKDHSKLSYQENQNEIFNTHKLVREYLNLDMNLFAPPSGAFNDYTIQVANSLGYNVIMWSKDTIDWRDKDTQLIYKRATSKLSNGDLILMHPTLNTAEALPQILQYCVDNGFNVVPVSANIVI